jgi:hypothetical protein
MRGLPLLDELMANAWRPVVVETRGGWRYRWAEGVTRRANSALAVGAGRSVEELVSRAESFYDERGVPARIQVTTASAPPSLAAYLGERGYESSARTFVEAAATGEVIDRTQSHASEIEITETPTDAWFDTYWSVEATRGRTEADEAVCRGVLLAPDLPTAFVAARLGSEVVGVGQLVIERDWGGVQCMATDPAHRRRDQTPVQPDHPPPPARTPPPAVEHLETPPPSPRPSQPLPTPDSPTTMKITIYGWSTKRTGSPRRWCGTA